MVVLPLGLWGESMGYLLREWNLNYMHMIPDYYTDYNILVYVLLEYNETSFNQQIFWNPTIFTVV